MKKVLIAAALFAAFSFNAAYADTTAASGHRIAVSVPQDDFKALEIDSLPQAVKDSVAQNYEGQTIRAAYVKDAGGVKTYKVTLVNAEGKTSDILFNGEGEALPAEKTETEALR